MADFSWFRFARSGTPNAPRSPTPPASHSSFSLGPLIGNSDASLFVREKDKIWYNPSLTQMVETLQVALMTRDLMEPLPIEYNAYILHLIEGFADAQEQIGKIDTARTEAKHSLEHHLEHFKTMADEWLERENQYKKEIKRLEVLLSRTSRDGLEAVTLARTNSVVDRNGPQAKEFVSRLKRLGTNNTPAPDISSDLSHETDKYMPNPIVKLLDGDSDILMREKMRQQYITANTITTRFDGRLLRRTRTVARTPNKDALVTGSPTAAFSDTESEPLFSDDVSDVDDKELMDPEDPTPQERQNRRHILDNLLDCEASQINGKDTSPQQRIHEQSCIIGLDQALRGSSIHSLDSRHLRGLSSMSGFSFVPGDDADQMLTSGGAGNEVTTETTAMQQDKANRLSRNTSEDAMTGLATPMRSWENQSSPVAKWVSEQELSTSSENTVIRTVDETNVLTAHHNSSTEICAAPLMTPRGDRPRNVNSASEFNVEPTKLPPWQ
ncbi:hypothetical protein F4781DRAFT_436868 [Annulohypoxylon bovei var. microspora]|nr:hypothetical protein F4781DRAFT_436868 [Annulohypoxylon bovei var. microspora]